MDLLNRAYTLLYDQLRSMTPSGRLTVGAAVAMVLAGVALVSVRGVSSSYVDLMHGVPVAVVDLPAMEAALAKANLKRYEIRGTSIYVPSGQEADYMAALATGKALPKRLGAALYDAVSSGSLFDIGSERDRERLKIAKQEVMAQLICEMPGIERAYVLIDVDDKPGGFRGKLITASACVKPAGSGQLDERTIAAIRKLVSGAIANLRPENVVVSDLNGQTWSGASEQGGGSGESRYLSLKRAYEQELTAKILNALRYIPDVAVATNVELSPEGLPRAKHASKTSAATGHQRGSEPQTAKDRRREASAPLQRPNTATMLKALIGGWQDDAKGEPAPSDHDVDDVTDPDGIGPTPAVARVSVGVPAGYFRQVWRTRNSARADADPQAPAPAALEQIRLEESEKIKQYVAPLLPTPEGAAKPEDLVTVTAFPDVGPDEPPAPTVSANLSNWARQSWRMLAVVALAMTALLMLRSLMHGHPTTTEAAVVPDDAPPEASEPMVLEPRVPRPHARRFHEAGRSVRDELSELIERDPDTAANVLRNWIGQVG